MAIPTPKHHHKIYRIALYGRSASGKSCLLAALAMPRTPHPYGLSCTWIPVDVPANDTTAHAEQLRAGRTWMQAALKMLSNGELLPPTADVISVRYDFTTPDHRTFQVELVDYPGEFIHTETSSGELAKQLRKQFSEMDGIIVLADAPYAQAIKYDKRSVYQNNLSQEQAEYLRDLTDLRQTFSLLRGERQEGAAFNVPVVMAISKWDRWSPITGQSNLIQEKPKLATFFSKNPAHENLRAILDASVTAGNFKAFPSSSLGPHRWLCNAQNQVIEVPAQTSPLLSFGLEDAFAWLVERRDEIDLHDFRQNANKKLAACQKAAQQLLKRFPDNSSMVNEINDILGKCRRKLRGYSAIALASVAGLWFVAETSFDMYKYRKYSAIAENPGTSEEELFSAEKWFSDYSLAPWFRHAISRLKLSREEASKTAYALQITGQAVVWKKMEGAATQETQYRAAQEYSAKYPHGPHAADAQVIISQIDLKREEAGYKQGWQAIQNQLAEADNDTNKLQNLLNQLASLETQHPSAALQYQEERQALQNQLGNRRAALVSQMDEAKFRDAYDKAMNAGDWVSAGKQLMERPDSGQLKTLREQFRQQVPRKIADKVKQQLAEGKFDPARQTLEIYARLPAPLKGEEGDKIIAESQKQYDASRDEHLYNEVKRNPNDTAIKAYLETAPLKPMIKEVEAYKEYLSKIDPNATLKNLKIRLVTISWRVSDGNQELTVLRNGNNDIVLGELDGEENEIYQANILGNAFEAKPEQILSIIVQLRGTDFWGVNNSADSTAIFSVTPKILAEGGYRVSLKNNDVTIADLNFGLLGYPPAPDLPAWRPMK